jgi:hypothetical protein
MRHDRQRLLSEAEHIAASTGSELARFNAERARMLGGRPPAPGERMPLPCSGTGGDIPENAG